MLKKNILKTQKNNHSKSDLFPTPCVLHRAFYSLICITAVHCNFTNTSGAEPAAVKIKQYDRPCSADFTAIRQEQWKDREKRGKKGPILGITVKSSRSAHAVQVHQGLL